MLASDFRAFLLNTSFHCCQTLCQGARINVIVWLTKMQSFWKQILNDFGINVQYCVCVPRMHWILTPQFCPWGMQESTIYNKHGCIYVFMHLVICLSWHRSLDSFLKLTWSHGSVQKQCNGIYQHPQRYFGTELFIAMLQYIVKYSHCHCPKCRLNSASTTNMRCKWEG